MGLLLFRVWILGGEILDWRMLDVGCEMGMGRGDVGCYL